MDQKTNSTTGKYYSVAFQRMVSVHGLIHRLKHSKLDLVFQVEVCFVDHPVRTVQCYVHGSLKCGEHTQLLKQKTNQKFTDYIHLVQWFSNNTCGHCLRGVHCFFKPRSGERNDKSQLTKSLP